MEALACRDGVELARAKGVSHLIVETDSQELFEVWEARGNQGSRVAPIIREIQDSRVFLY